MRRRLAAGHGDVDELGRHALDQVVLAIEEGQPTRLRGLDDVDLDAVEQRQRAAGELLRDRLPFGVIGGRLGLPQHLAVAWVALQHDARRAPPGAQPERPGAHRVLHDLVAVELHHLARHGAVQVRDAQALDEARTGLLQPEAQRRAVECAQALQRRVVVEGLLAVQRLLAPFVEAHDAPVLHAREQRALGRRIGEAQDRVDVVLRHQFTRFALERRVVGEEDARLDAHRVLAPFVGDLGQRHRDDGHDLRGPREMVVTVETVEDVGGDDARVDVRHLRRVEAGLGHRKAAAQQARARAIGGWGGHRKRRRQAGGRQRERVASLHRRTPQCAAPPGSMSM